MNWIALCSIGLSSIIDSVWIGLNWLVLNWIELNGIESNWFALKWIEWNWIALHWDVLHPIGLHLIACTCSCSQGSLMNCWLGIVSLPLITPVPHPQLTYTISKIDKNNVLHQHFHEFSSIWALYSNTFWTSFSVSKKSSNPLYFLTFWKTKIAFRKRCYIKPKSWVDLLFSWIFIDLGFI